MAGRIFWDVDTQYDFVREGGKLYVPGAEQLIPSFKRLNEHAHAQGIRVIASADDHVPEHEEISDAPDFHETYPPHCLRGTLGQQKIPETALRDPLLIEPVAIDRAELERRVRQHRGDILFHKHWFDVFTNPNVEPVLEELDPDEIVVYGVALDVCNRYVIEGLLERRPKTKVRLVTDATLPIVAARGQALLERWRKHGVQLIRTDEALRGEAS
jgi:nicotinamidase/pyrazinamidase